MKRIAFFLLTILLLVSCGTRNGYFKMEGRFLHMNSGELYLYSTDGGINGIDTIKVEAGRFAYEIPCSNPSTLVVLFPNYSTQPIFAESGEAVEIKADASHLKEMEVTGTEANELMTSFRKQVASVSPPDERKDAIQFIKDHPESVVSVYLLNKYLIATEAPDYKEAKNLTALLLKAQPQNPVLQELKGRLAMQGNTNVGSSLPKFSVKATDGKTITNASLSGKTTIISSWSVWSYESMEIQRAINEAVKQGKINALGICVEPNSKDCNRILANDAIQFPNVCDGKMLQTKLLKTFNLSNVPDNIVVRNGKIIERNITANTIRQRLADNKF